MKDILDKIDFLLSRVKKKDFKNSSGNDKRLNIWRNVNWFWLNEISLKFCRIKVSSNNANVREATGIIMSIKIRTGFMIVSEVIKY